MTARTWQRWSELQATQRPGFSPLILQKGFGRDNDDILKNLTLFCKQGFGRDNGDILKNLTLFCKKVS